MDSNLIKYDPLLFKLPKGVVTKGTQVGFFVEIHESVSPKQVLFMCKEDNDADFTYIEMEKTQMGYVLAQNFNESGHYWYNFKVVFDNYSLFIKYLLIDFADLVK